MISWSKKALTVMLVLLLIFIDIPRWIVSTESVAKAAVSFADGSGLANDPYLIATAEQLDAIRLDLDSHYMLIANIDLSDYQDNGGWIPIGSTTNPFTGTLNGAISGNDYREDGSYQISNLYMDNSVIDEEKAFIHTIGSTGLVKYVDFVDVNLQTGEKSAVIAITNNGEVTKVNVSGQIISNDNYVAGVVVFNEQDMSDVSFTGNIEGADYVGGIVSENNDHLVISRYKGTIVGDSYVGGFAAVNHGRLVGNDMSGNIDGIDYVGGIAGENIGELSNVWYINGHISGESYVGGIVGKNSGKVEDAKLLNLDDGQDRKITGESYVGGIIGYNDDGNLYNATINGNVNGYESVGGLIGNQVGGLINDGVFNGTVTGIDDVGGAVGNARDGSQIENVKTKGSIIGEVNVGGLVGKLNNSSLTLGTSQSTVVGVRDVGGLVGNNDDSEISRSTAQGNVTGEEDTGGLVGDNDGIITTSNATGSVVGKYSVGGLVGDNDNQEISNSYAHGDVTGIDEVGGLVGSNIEGSITNSYSIGGVTGTSLVGGLVGFNTEDHVEGIVTSSYYDLETSGQQDSEKGLGLSTINMKLVNSYVNWDFDIIWQINSINNYGYPYHQGMDVFLIYTSNEEDSSKNLYDSQRYHLFNNIPVNDNIYGWSKHGYTFNGWNTKSNGTGDHYNANDYIYFEEDTVLYAQWKLNAPVTVIETPTNVLSSNADLSMLELRNGEELLTLDPVFTASKVSYGTTTTAAELMLKALPVDASAEVSYGQEKLISSIKIDLQLGENIVTLLVRAENGIEKRYTITITREVEEQVAVCPFTDIVGHWAKANICEASSIGIVEGKSSTLFVPDEAITRTEATSLLLRVLGIEVESSAEELNFSDAVEIPVWAKNIIATSLEKDIVRGYPDGTFRPEQIITRAELSALVARAMKWESNAGATLPFKDRESIPTWATSYVHSAYTNDLIEGRSNGLFVPNGVATRAEATVIMLRLWKLNQDM